MRRNGGFPPLVYLPPDTGLSENARKNLQCNKNGTVQIRFTRARNSGLSEMEIPE
jgi:hypothetical protein